MSKRVVIKTKVTDSSVAGLISSIPDEQKREDSFTLLEIMQGVSGLEPKVWGTSIIGFGNQIYKSPATGREVEWFLIGFAPRKSNLSVYFMDLARHEDALKKLGKHKTGKGCLYFNKLADIDQEVLSSMIRAALN